MDRLYSCGCFPVGAPCARPHARMTRKHRPCAAAALWLAAAWLGSAARAQEQANPGGAPKPAPPEKVELSSELASTVAADAPGTAASGDLMLFEDIPLVVSSGRRPQKATMSAAAVSVLTKEDIHAGGWTNIPDALRFVPGVDVLQVDRNRWAVGVRGLHDGYSDRTLLLLNGRIAESPIFGGPEWARLPVFMEDIERVEVVRGPGGAAWGANAYNGVINIITKGPRDVKGVFGSSTVNEFGDVFSHVRWADESGPWAWRLSFGYDDLESSENAIANDRFASRDFQRNYRFDGETTLRLGDDTDLTFGLGASHVEFGSFEFLNTVSPSNNSHETVRAFARLDHEFESGAKGTLQWYGNFADTDEPAISRFTTLENVLEAQLGFQPAEDHDVTIGATGRFTHFENNTRGASDLRLLGTPLTEGWAGAYVMDRWTVSSRFALEGQLRGDWYSETHPDWAARLAGILSLDAKSEHTLRMAVARSFRTPLLSTREVRLSRFEFAPGLFAINVFPGIDLDNEGIVALELGYSGVLAPGLTLRADGYYNRYSDLIGYTNTPVVVGPVTIANYRAANIDGGQGYGGELELALAGEHGRVSVWCAYNGFEPDQRNQELRSFWPAAYKAGATARLYLDENWTLSGFYRYTDVTRDDTDVQNVGVSHQIDVGVSRRLFEGRGELMIGVRDLLDQTDQTVFNVGSLTAHETPGRAFFVRAQFKF